MMGWTYWDLMALPSDVYTVLIEQVQEEGARAAAREDAA